MDTTTVTLDTVLQFFRADQIPHVGDPRDPSLHFNSANIHVYPTASTCAIELTLPTKYSTYGEFKHSLTTGFLYHGGFGLS